MAKNIKLKHATMGMIDSLKQPGETVDEVIQRAFRALEARPPRDKR